MIKNKARLIGVLALSIIASGCTTTGGQKGNANMQTCSLAGGMLWGLGGAAQSAATAGIGLAAGALIGGAGCAAANDRDQSQDGHDSHEVVKKVSVSHINTLFNFDSYTLVASDKTNLDKVVDIAGSNTKIRIAGHTCNIGASTYNQSLSVKRANAVRDYLVSQGVMSSSITVEGKGEHSPVASNDTREGRAQNRRTEVKVLRTTTDQSRMDNTPRTEPESRMDHRKKLEQYRGASLDPYLMHRY